MSPVVAPEGLAAITGRIAAIEYRLTSLAPDRAATAAALPTATQTSSNRAGVSATGAAFATALTDAVASGVRPAAGSAAAGGISGSGTSSSSITGDDVLTAGKKYLGIPYVWGGTTTSGLDCSGLVQLTFKDLGIDLPRVSRDQATVGTAVPSMAEARPGDLIAFGSPVNHIAIYAGNNQILEAPQPGQNVKFTEIHREPVAIRRVVPAGDGTTAGASTDLTGGVIAVPNGTYSATHAAPAGDGGSADGPAGNGVGEVGSAGGASALGIPPSLLARFDATQLADVPRAVPLAALGVSTVDSGAAWASQLFAGSSDTARAPGVGEFSAAQLSAAGLSDAVASFADKFAAAEQKFNLPTGVLAAVAQAESGGRTDAVSPAGAQGLMQLMPGTATALGVADPFDPAQAINGAAKYLSDNLTAFDGSLTNALAAYNAGPGAVRRYGGVPPYAETQNYVQKITDILARLT